MDTTLLVSDLDNTLLGDDAALDRFVHWLTPQRTSLRLAYASGRTFASIAHSVAHSALPDPDVVICNVGTEVATWPGGDELAGWRESISRNWSASEVRNLLADVPRLEPQPPECQTELKVSYYLHDATPAQLKDIRNRIVAAGIHGQVVYSSSRDLDVLPAGADKGAAAAFLALHWEIPFDRVIVAGDSGNDLALFREGFRGVVVANAQPELKSLHGSTIYHAARPMADGVREGVSHWLALMGGASDIEQDRRT
jgi:sucrose phosphatase-like protein